MVLCTLTENSKWLHNSPNHRRPHPQHLEVSLESEFMGNLYSALAQLGHIDNKHDSLADLYALTDPTKANQHSILQTICTLLLSSREYEKASLIIRECSDVCPADVAEWRKQLWKLLHTYIAEIVTVEAIATSPYCESVRASSIVGQVAPDMKFMVKNKVVFNAALVIIDIVQALRSAKYDYVIDRAPELQKYATRYGSTKRTPRTARFMRMLSALVAADFDPVEADRRASAIRAKYADADSVVRDDAELIPYDDLWKVVVHHLNRARQTK